MRVTCGEDHPGPALCVIHSGAIGPSVPPPERRCAALTRDGRRCRSWALPAEEREDGKARCAVHAGRAGIKPGEMRAWKHGAHSHRLFPDDLARMAETKRLLREGRLSLEMEIVLARQLMRRLLAGTHPQLEPQTSEVLLSAELLFRGSKALAHALKTEKMLQEQRREAEAWDAWAEQVLREMEEE